MTVVNSTLAIIEAVREEGGRLGRVEKGAGWKGEGRMLVHDRLGVEDRFGVDKCP